MKVFELIEYLKKVPNQNLEIGIWYEGGVRGGIEGIYADFPRSGYEESILECIFDADGGSQYHSKKGECIFQSCCDKQEQSMAALEAVVIVVLSRSFRYES